MGNNGRPSRSESEIESIANHFLNDPSTSLRKAEMELGIPRSTIHDILRKITKSLSLQDEETSGVKGRGYRETASIRSTLSRRASEQ